MSIIGLILVFVVVGLILWLINTYVPMEAGIKRLMNIAVIIIMVLWLIQILGLFGSLNAPVPRLRPLF